MAVGRYFERAGVPLLVLDLSAAILQANAEAKAVLGTDLVGRPVQQLFSQPAHWDDCLKCGAVETTLLARNETLRATVRATTEQDETLVTIVVHEVRDVLAGLHQILSAGGDLGYLFSKLTPFLRGRVPYARCSLAIWHEERERFEVYSHHPGQEDGDQHGELLGQDALGGELLEALRETDDVLLRQSLPQGTREELAQQSGILIRSTAHAPLHYQRRFLGALNLGREQAEVWTSHDAELLRAMIGPLGLAVSVTLAIRNLRRSEAKYRELYEEAPVMYHTLDGSGRIVDCNRREAEMLGYAKQELLGKRLADLLTERSRAEFQETVELVRTSQPERIQAEREFLRKDGTVLYASVTSTILYDEQGALVGARTIARDVTEQKVIQQRLLQTQKLEGLGTMVAGITHEFNNLLGPILGYSQMLQRRQGAGGRSTELEQIEEAARKARDILQSLLRFTRQARPQKQYQDLRAVIENTLPLVKSRATSKNVAISTDIGDQLPWTRVDEVQMTQLFINLLNNGIDACSEGGLIKITLARSGPWIRVLVQDTGHGIADENLPYLFDPFFTTKPAGEGTGLGLATCFGILAEHGGSIQAYNGTLDGRPGACFEILLPIRRHPTQQIRRSLDARDCDLDLRERRALVVEDDLRYNNLICDLLESRGAEVSSALDGVQASRMLAEGGSWHLIVADVRMPQMNGFEFHAWVGDQRPDLAGRMLFVTGDTMDKQTQEFLRQDGIPSLNKPFEVKDFYRSVHSVVQRASLAESTCPPAGDPVE